MGDQPIVVTCEGDVVTSEQAIEHLDGLCESRHACLDVVETDARRQVFREAVSCAKTEFNASA